MGQIKNIKLHIVTDIKITNNMGYIKVTQPGDWIPVCEEMVRQLHELGFHRRQLWHIDIHSNGPGEDGIISAHWENEPCGCDIATAEIGFEVRNDTDDWHDHYAWGEERAAELRAEGKRIISISNAANSGGRGITVLWYESQKTRIGCKLM